jgi:hypothetical protein
MRYSVLPLAAALVLTGACGSNTATSPSATPAQTVADPTTTETFAGVVPVNGFRFYSFTSAAYGTINVTLTAVDGQFVPPTVMLGIALGQPDAADCAATTTVNAAAAATAQITGTYAAGIYCVRVADIGNLFAPAGFDISIAHP